MSEKGMSGSTELAQDTPADYFCPADAAELQEIVAQADRTKKSLSVYKDKPLWTSLVKSVMGLDYSWKASAKEYINLFNGIMKKQCA